MTSPRYRTVWISDVHLGTRACQAKPLLDFLGSVRCEHLYLVGDIIDFRNLRRRGYWPDTHRDVVRGLLRGVSRRAKVTYIPGNHDAMLRRYGDFNLGPVEVRRQSLHTTADGRRVLILHGDEFDWTSKDAAGMVALGDLFYDLLLALGRAYHRLRRRFGWPYWSLPAFVKRNVWYIADFVAGYRRELARYARRMEAQVVVTGHVHRPEIKKVGDVVYCNCGDWLENCTALVEHEDGRLEILYVERDAIGAPVGAAPGAALRASTESPA